MAFFMKRIVLIGCVFLILSCLVKRGKSDIPQFNLLLVDSSTVVNPSKDKPGRPTVIIYFSPDCLDCQEETDALISRINEFKNIDFVFVTIDAMERLRVFVSHYKLNRFDNVIVGKDISFGFFNYYKPKATPFTVVFNKDKSLVGAFLGSGDRLQILINLMHKIQGI